MDVTPVLAPGAKPVSGYGPGFFRIGDELINAPILLWPDAVEAAPVATLAELTAAHITAICQHASAPQVLLLGMGPLFDTLPPKELRLAARAAGVILEPMDSGAACRTWNVLLAEGRRVAALIWPV